MSVFHNNILAGASGAGGAAEFTIERSLRFNRSDSAYLTRTPSSAGNRRTWTWSGWVKLGRLASDANVHGHLMRVNTGPETAIRFKKDGQKDCIQFFTFSGSLTSDIQTDGVFRDPAAWYHIVVACDTTQSTSSNRVKIYVNGVLQTLSTSTYPSQNYDTGFNTTNAHAIGATASGSEFFDGYLAEVNFVDGTALAASDFGEYDSDNVWQPIDYSGSRGTNGFRLDFSDNSSTSALGSDAAGGNNWTPNNFSVTAGIGNDSLIDSPMNYEADSGNNGGNYCVMNPLTSNGAITFSNGNLDTVNPGGTQDNPRGTIGVSSGKWYWECEITAFAGGFHVGIATTESVNTGFLGNNSGEWAYGDSGKKYVEGSASNYGASFASVGEVISVVFDADAGTLTFWNDGVSQGQAASGLTNGPYLPAMYARVGNTGGSWNFGQRPFKYTPPSGYKALCTQNLTDPTIDDGSDYFDVVKYSGTGSAQTISGLAFNPDLVWIKKRSGTPTRSHSLHDSVRGSGRTLQPDNTSADESDAQALTSFNSNGFSIGTEGRVNDNGGTYVAWAWDCGTSAAASNTDGSITSSVRASTSAGFSIVEYPGNGTNGATVGHGLNAAPSFIIVKVKSITNDWKVYHKSLGTGSLGLNQTGSKNSSGSWNGTHPTSSVFSLDDSYEVNRNPNNYIAYCWTPVEGFSAFGKYVGNGNADGPVVFTGFRPRWVLFKLSSSSGDWRLMDTERDPYNPCITQLYPNNTDNEIANSSAHNVDYLSNGFRVTTSHPAMNDGGHTMVWAAFAEHPFKTARAR